MGHNMSLPKGRKNSMRSSFSLKSVRKSRSNSRPSYTFRMNENSSQIHHVNINSASEEELMTLNGVNREMARNIIEHRKIIGRFKKVEDLVLVKGVGATKMQELRLEISVSNRKLQSRASSRAPSYDSLNSHESRSTYRSNKVLNVNRATIFDLQGVEGITQEIAASIVHYRSKKGNFKNLEDLLKVKGIDKMLLYHTSIFLTVDNIEDSSEGSESRQKTILTSCHTMPDFIGTLTSSNNLPCTNGTLNLSDDILELLSIYSPRPLFQRFTFKNGELPAVRIGAWNLSEFSVEKASNFGVKEVVCRTILENGLSILALQDIVNVTALRIICEELNNPKLQKIKDWNYEQHFWNFCMLDEGTSKLGFMYDSQGVFDIKLSELYEGPHETRNECEALIATFTIDNLYLQLANLMIKTPSNLDILYGKLKELTCPNDMSLVFIDLSEAEEVKLPNTHLKSLNLPNTSNHYSEDIDERSKTHNISNILFNPVVDKHRTGASGVVKQGLTHLSIPNGWSWGGSVSPHCPVWIELFLNPITVTDL